jgi:6-pyruvoyltetrahydropterin/6-carboxytetrahydropterin synthase
MHRVARELHFCYGHRLLDYDGKCRHLHGHNGRAVIMLETDHLDALGMVVDFGKLKQSVGGWIDEELDHKMLLHKDDPILETLRKWGEPVFVMDVNPTAENIARLIFEFAMREGFPVIEVQLWETASCYASYNGEWRGERPLT